MGLFSKFVDIIKANINDLLDKAEDPEKMIKLMIVEMQEAVVKATSALAQAMGNRNRLQQQYLAAEKQAEHWQQQARLALEKGKEDLAREALNKKVISESNAAQFKAMYESAEKDTAKLKEQVDQLKQKLEEARMKESMLIARSQTAKAKKEIAKKVGGLDQNSFAKFDKFEEKIIKIEAEAEAFSEMADAETKVRDQFRELEKEGKVDEELEKLKAELNK
ncbi:MAG: PspA/IM30 family protein [Ignavibacteriales bacterium]|nr:PspA/IM30 family protein [Ignavibacteriales bacterium]